MELPVIFKHPTQIFYKNLSIICLPPHTYMFLHVMKEKVLCL